MSTVTELVKRLFVSERGQTLVEYILLVVLIAIVVIIMLTGLGGNLNNSMSTVNSSMP